ncbi:MAG: TetR/AcrR family transcriptional regulator [Rhizobiaceae bacterium]
MARIAGSDSAKTRALIYERALALSAQTGFEALTMRALAAGVGVQVAAIYHYFPDKQSLLASLLTAHFDRLLSAAHALPQSGSASQRLHVFARFHIIDHASNRPAALLAAQELRSLNRTNAGLILPKRQSYERLLRQILSDGAVDGSFHVLDIGLTAAAMLAMLSEVAVWFRPGGKANLDDVAHTYASAALKMVRA